MNRQFDARTVDLLSHLGSTQGSKNIDTINIDAVQPVLEINQGGMIDPQPQKHFTSGGALAFSQQIDGFAALAGSVAEGNILVYPQGFANPWAPSAIAVTNPLETRMENTKVLGLMAQVVFNAAGAVAFNGKRIRLLMSCYRTSGTNGMFYAFTEYVVATGRLRYMLYPTNGTCGQIVPWDCALDVYVISDDGTAFPAATMFSCGLLAAVRPRNCPLPIF